MRLRCERTSPMAEAWAAPAISASSIADAVFVAWASEAFAASSLALAM